MLGAIYKTSLPEKKKVIFNKKLNDLFCWFFSDINWNLVNEDIKQEIGLQSKDDGEFWMSYRDFCKQFQEVTICLTGPDFEDDEEVESAGK